MYGVSSLFTDASNGLNNVSRQLTPTAQQVATPSANSSSLSVDDLTRQAVDLINEKTLYEADAVVINTANHLLGTLLDMLDIDAR